MSTANDRTPEQAPHYVPEDGGPEQHWDRAWKLYREAWFVLNVTKYVERYRRKNGLADLRKARHYLDKLIELEGADVQACRGAGCPHGTNTEACEQCSS
jgi:hypothetical protein